MQNRTNQTVGRSTDILSVCAISNFCVWMNSDRSVFLALDVATLRYINWYFWLLHMFLIMRARVLGSLPAFVVLFYMHTSLFAGMMPLYAQSSMQVSLLHERWLAHYLLIMLKFPDMANLIWIKSRIYTSLTESKLFCRGSLTTRTNLELLSALAGG